MGSDPNHTSTLCYRVKSNSQQVRPLGRESWLRRVYGFRKTLKNPKRSFDIILKILIRILSNSCQALMEAYWTTQKRVCKNSAELTQFRRRFTSFPMKSVGVTSLKNVFHLWTFSELYQHILSSLSFSGLTFRFSETDFSILCLSLKIYFLRKLIFRKTLLPGKFDFSGRATSRKRLLQEVTCMVFCGHWDIWTFARL